jgi:AAA domain
MALRKATRQKAKIRLGLSAVSGGGKTYSALLIAHGICGDWSKIAVIDSENNSADLYAHLGDFNVLPLSAPFNPEKYVEAIKECEKAGMEVIIVDSISHEWDGKGGCLEIVDSLGGKFADWAKVTPRHQAFVDAIIQSTAHMITTVRRKQDYEMIKDGSGKLKVEKAGLKEVTREGFEYELTINLELDMKHNATASKDRTGLFMNKPAFVPDEKTGQMIRNWCEHGDEVDHSWYEGIENCKTKKELVQFYNKHKKDIDISAALQKIMSDRQNKLKADEAFVKSWKEVISKCKDMDELVQLWDSNDQVVSSKPMIKALFDERKLQFQNN